MTNNKPRLIAFYLPQYHPIPENDEWWGKGFTEWTNVAKAKPFFKGHYQPHIPADLGFYDLRVPEVREQQAELAREAGIEGFCYWYLWSDGRRLLERPLNEMMQMGKPDFPFCLGWDNETWTGVWHNAPERILREQIYPGIDDDVAHFYSVLLPAFKDDRYIRVDDKPFVVVFRPADLPPGTLETFRKLSISNGFKGICFTGIIKNKKEGLLIKQLGFDSYTISKTAGRGIVLDPLRRILIRLLGEKKAAFFYHTRLNKPLYVYDYQDILPFFEEWNGLDLEYFPCIMPNWDNTPRAGVYGHVWRNASPEIFREHLRKAIIKVVNYPDEHKIIIIKSWNEWAEGNYLEPDLKNGHGYLNAIRDELGKL